MLKKWLLKFLGIEKRIVELEKTTITQQEWLDRHESNLMILHKKITAAEFMSKKHYVRIKRLETK